MGKLKLEQLRAGLATRRIGRRIETHDTVDSTNRLAWARAEEGDADGLAVLAEYQTQGRGRLGRQWVMPRGAGVMMSVVLEQKRETVAREALALVAAVAVVDALHQTCGVLAEIKWPNDIMARERKLGGVLIEAEGSEVPGASVSDPSPPRRCVVGIGVNCLQHRGHFPPELRASATSLELESPQAVDRTAVARTLIVELDRWLADPESWDAAMLREAWVRRAQPLERVCLRHGGREFRGQVIDIDPAVGLLVQLDEGGRRLFSATETTVMT